MTGQMPDRFYYEGERYALIGIDGTDLYEAADFGIETQVASTACWRGHIMKYDCIDGALVLDGMDVRTQNAPPINSVNPMEPSTKIDGVEVGYSMFSHTYENLKLKTKFTGAMLLGKDFIEGMYVHMGFQRAIAYGKVIELQVQDGDIISESDLSERMEKLRNQDPDKGAQPESKSDEDVSKWISDSFSRDYDVE